MKSKGLFLSVLLLIPICVQAYEKVHFTENGLVYCSVLPAGCGHYLGRHDSTDVIVCGYESPERFSPEQPLQVAYSVIHNGMTYNVVGIGKEAFAGLHTVEKVIVEDGIEELNSYAFALMPNLKSVKLPSTLNSLGRNLFYESNNLTEILMNPGDSWDSPEGCNAIISSEGWDRMVLLAGCSTSKIPAFIEEIDEDAFCGCQSLERIVIPEGVKKIRYGAFSGCTNLKEVILPESLEEIYSGAFANCISLKSIFIPKNVKELCGDIFEGCHHLSSIVVDKDNPTYDSRSHCNGIVRKSDSTLVSACKTTVITKDIKRLGISCFNDINIHSLRIPKTLEEFSGWAFAGCKEIDEISVDPKNPNYMSPEGSNVILTKDEKTLVVGCRTSEIPESVEIIDCAAFYGRYSNHLLKLPEGLKVIGRRAFAYCNEINNVVIPSSLTSLDEAAFEECHNLYTVQILAPLEKTEYSTFGNCKKLISINIPESMKVIGYHTFDGCSNLKNVCLPSTIEEIGIDAFRGCPYSEKKQDSKASK
jgi:hypothetical protein